jgi:formylglycine-generating enzyme required for sulfatase activity
MIPAMEPGAAVGAEGGRSASGTDDGVLDLWLDARLRGEAEDLDAFCARHAVSPATRARLAAIHAVAASRAPQGGGAAPADRPGERFGDFRIVRRLDEGGMGAVFLAVQESLQREVALKVLRPELRDSPSAEARFRREGLALGRLRHPNIVSVIAVGEERGVRWIAMELVPGRTLDEVLADASAAGQRVAAPRALAWARDLARALQCAHEHGVVHRDVKPGNVRITPDDRPLLIDFGIARDARDEAALTQTFTGSPLYAAPEQLAGAALDGRADVYGLGATLYQCLTGRVPFEGGTMEQVLRRVLAEDPPPPRRLERSIPRDAETVVLTALAKEPDRRYASAAAFAEDLDAVLTSRPIRARPPGPLVRLAKWARRHPAPAAVLATAALALLVLAGVTVANERAAAADRRRRVDEAFVQARARLGGYRERRAAAQRSESDVATLRHADTCRCLTREEDEKLRAAEEAVDSFHRERELPFQEVLELLRFAERLDPDATAAADGVRAELYRERWLESRAAHDVAAEAFYKRRVADFDRAGRFAKELNCVRRLEVASDPPGARVHLFRFREQAEVVPGGERRLVPVPRDGTAWPVAPGTVARRVVAGAGDLVPGDVVLSPPGASPARVWTHGAVREMELPPAVELRPTAAPAFASDATVAGTTPLAADVEEGGWLLVLEAPGRERVVHAVAVPPDAECVRVTLHLPAEGETPRGFVRVEPQDGEAPAFSIMEHEVTAAEYLEFLDDPATLARIAASKEPALFPRSAETRLSGGFWPRGEDGRYALPDDQRPDWPVLGVSYRDAQEYAAWRTAHDGRAGREYALPRMIEWVWATGFRAGRVYAFGHRFSTKWVKCCYARPVASPEPVMSYPVDESPFGVFDTAGSAYEWIDWWFDEPRRLRLAAGGSWGQTDPRLFLVWGGVGAPETEASGETGFRLVCRAKGTR